MTEKKAVVVSHAELIPTMSLTQFVVRQLTQGLPVRVVINGKSYDGYVHQLDFSRGVDYVFANVWVDIDGDEGRSVKVSIHRDGTVMVLRQDEE